MTKDEILKMPAGREMDKLVIGMMEWVEIDKAINYKYSMGIRWSHQDDGVWKFQPGLAWRWSPSTDIAAAWEVVEKLHDFQINRHHVFWLCSFGNNESVQGDSAPLAICRAALLGNYIPSEMADNDLFCSEHQCAKNLVDYPDGSRYECPECQRERGEALGLV